MNNTASKTFLQSASHCLLFVSKQQDSLHQSQRFLCFLASCRPSQSLLDDKTEFNSWNQSNQRQKADAVCSMTHLSCWEFKMIFCQGQSERTIWGSTMYEAALRNEIPHLLQTPKRTVHEDVCSPLEYWF